MDLERLAAAGLYDPDAPGSDDRLELLGYILDAGATIEEMVEADRSGNLASLVLDLRLSRGDLSAADIARKSGTPLDEVLEGYRLLGIPVPDPAEPIFADCEVRLFEMLPTGAVSQVPWVRDRRGVLPEGMIEEILRSTGSALAMVAESAVTAFVGSIEDDLLQKVSPLARAEITTATGEMGLELGQLMAPLLRHHLWLAVQRQRATMLTSTDRLQSKLSIGFVDLVSFTPVTAAMSPPQLLEFMRRFHSRTYDVVTRSGGRVVKLIGDEVMFASGNLDAGCEIALSLIEAFEDADSLPRGGLAHGMVVARHGDFYGPIVNLAARLTDIAVPGEVLADAALASLAPGSGFDFEPAGRRLLKGFPEPVTVASIHRAR